MATLERLDSRVVNMEARTVTQVLLLLVAAGANVTASVASSLAHGAGGEEPAHQAAVAMEMDERWLLS